MASNFHIFVSFCTCSVAKKELDELERWKEEHRLRPIKLIPQRLGKTFKSAIMNWKIRTFCFMQYTLYMLTYPLRHKTSFTVFLLYYLLRRFGVNKG